MHNVPAMLCQMREKGRANGVKIKRRPDRQAQLKVMMFHQ
ncbi:hypothetical protein [Pseudomonas phage Achelous]|uniref:Uncharacterized protein n=1 Tax=Pseudomonas phage Achelous TaxID=2163982 RepID=A0A2S1GMR0_9CAUD|nr:hypothetical protein HOT10_gp05 [Pseudomonas phage Achelous]AWD90682.1 hypothetical protein [Pseudomonas phage Achelous]